MQTFNILGGIEHALSRNVSTFFYQKVNEEYPNIYSNYSNYSNSDPITIYQGSYYAKIGVTYDEYVNTYVEGRYKEAHYGRHMSRELSAGLNLLVGVHSSIQETEVEYLQATNGGQSEYKTEQVDFTTILPDKRLGFEISFYKKEYSGNVVPVKLHCSLGLLPGHFDRTLPRTLFRVGFAVGMGRILKEV